MKEQEGFERFKKNLVEENEAHYGREVRERYGDAVVDASNAKVLGMSEAEHEDVEALSRRLHETLLAAMATGDPSSPLAQETCALHKEWLCRYWSAYSKEAHRSLAEGYVTDLRFKKYYDAIAKGSAEFLRDALHIYCR